MSVAPDTDVAAEPAANPTQEEPAITAPEPSGAAETPIEPTIEAILADSDDASFRLLLDGLDGGLVAGQIQEGLDQELDCETLIDRLAEALADEGSTEAELTAATPVLAAIAVRGLLHDGEDDLPAPAVAADLAAAMAAAIGSLIETGLPDAIQALPGLMRQIEHRAARDRIGGGDLIPVLRRMAERVALDPAWSGVCRDGDSAPAPWRPPPTAPPRFASSRCDAASTDLSRSSSSAAEPRRRAREEFPS